MHDRLANSPWRQACLISATEADKLGLKKCWHIVISHDCDLAHGECGEPWAELIPADEIGELDGNRTHAKNPRILHLAWEPLDLGSTLNLEMRAAEKLCIKRSLLESFTPDRRFNLGASGLATLQSWLAARYRRSAFPEGFEDIWRSSKAQSKLQKQAKKLGQHLLGIFFNLDDGEELVHESQDDPWLLDVLILYLADNTASTAAAHEMQTAIQDELRKAFLLDTGWRGIELRRCEAVSEEVLTYRQYKDLKKWNLDYISNADPEQETST